MRHIKQYGRGKTIIQAGRDIKNVEIHPTTTIYEIKEPRLVNSIIFRIVMLSLFVLGTALLMVLPNHETSYARYIVAGALWLYCTSCLMAFEYDRHLFEADIKKLKLLGFNSSVET
jgi:hypothetical protein